MKKFRPFTARFFGAAIALSALIGSLLVLPAPMGAWASSSGTTTKELCTSSNAPTFNGGSGTALDPWLISSQGNLETLEGCVRNNISTRNASAAYYLQTVDIEITIDDFGIAVTHGRSFKASYDGGNYAVYGLDLTVPAPSVWSEPHHAGLFAQGENCSIRNLTVSGNVKMEGPYAHPVYSGILMGKSDGCDLENVKTFGVLNHGNTGGATGGIVGWARNTTIKDSSSHVDVTGGATYNGGAIGRLSHSPNKTTLENVGVYPASDAWDNDTIRGKLVVTKGGGVRSGGVAGQFDGEDGKFTVDRTWSAIPVSSAGTLAANSDTWMGGLVGQTNRTGEITKSFSTGSLDFTLKTETTSTSFLGWRLGGLVGGTGSHVDGTVINKSYSTSDITAVRSSDDTDRGRWLIGGLVGHLNRANLDESFFFGSITREGGGISSNPKGLAGDVTNGAVTKSYANTLESGVSLLTTEEFADQASFVNWDFNETWTMGDSTPLHKTPSVAPGAPTITNITPGNGQLTVAFTPPSSDGGDPITEYQYLIDGVFESDFVVTSSPFVVSGLTNGTTYTVTLKAINDVDSSPSSAGVSGTPAATAPDAPTITNITPGDGQLTVAFTAPLSDGGDPITEYQYLIDGVFESDFVVTSSPFVVSGLTNGTTYTVTLKAKNDVDSSPPSTGVTGTPVAPEADPAPTSAPAPKPGSTPTVEPSVSPTPTATPPAPTPPVSEPETAVLAVPPSGSPPPSNPPATPSSPPAATPAGPGVATLTSEELMSGSIALNRGTEAVIMPAVLLHDIAVGLLPPGAPLDEGALKIETGQTLLVVMVVSLGDVTLTASELGGFIQFTLIAPGFESNSMTLTVTKQTLAALFWVQVGLIAAAVAVGLGLLWWFLGRRNRKQVRVASAPRPAFA